MEYHPLSDYGVIGNDQRCALVAGDGSIDWCCFPDVASPSVFARLLDAEDGGHFAINPTDHHGSEQDYLDQTNVLETHFESSSGAATLTDFMPVSDRQRDEDFQQALYRHLHCEEGQLMVEVDFKPRPDYGRAKLTLEDDGKGVMVRSDSGERFHFQTCGPFEPTLRNDRAVGTTFLEAGDDVWFVLQYNVDQQVTAADCRQAEEETLAYWQQWGTVIEERADDIVGGEPWYDEFVRSALALKLLINDGSGGIYAAATTSMPEEYGGSDNWDYRYNWIRDAKFTVQALYNLGQEDAAHEYFEWFRNICHERPEAIQPVYGVHGDKDLTERTLDHLDGHRFSTPVRIGNAAADQHQLDVYGTIVQGLYETLLEDQQLTEEDWESIRAIVDHVCEVWEDKGAGIWEFREESRHYVHSKLLCWVAVDRGIELAEHYDVETDISRWKTERQALREAIEEQGYSETVGSFVQHFETEETLDATCLLLPIFDFLPPDDERIEATLETVMDELLTEEGLVHRTSGPDSRSEGPGAFLFCTFWLVDALVLAGREEKARDIFTNVLEHVESPYLLSERIDPRTGEFYGNFPQAFSHIGLINSAIYLSWVANGEGVEHDPVSQGELQPLFRP